MFEVVTLTEPNVRPWNPPLNAIRPGRPVTRRASLSDGFDRLRAGVREEDRVERVGHRLGDHLGQAADGLEIAQRVADVEELVDLLVDGLRHGRVVMAERRGGDAVREIEVAPARGVDQLVALAAIPGTLEVAAEDRREVRLRQGRVVVGGGDGSLDGGIHRRSIGNAAPRMQRDDSPPGGPRRARGRRPSAFRSCQRDRLQPDRREPPRAADGARLRRGRDRPAHPRLGRGGRGPSARSSRSSARSASSARRSPRPTAGPAPTTSASPCCARSWSGPTPRFGSSRASTSG